MPGDDTRPHIIVLSSDCDDTLTWLSDGWYAVRKHGTPEAERLKIIADKAIRDATDVHDAIRLLGVAGFRVTRGTGMDIKLLLNNV